MVGGYQNKIKIKNLKKKKKTFSGSLFLDVNIAW